MYDRLGPRFQFAQSEGKLVGHFRAGRTWPLLVLVAVVSLADVASWIEAQGGTVEHNRTGRVTSVNLRAAWITDTDLAKLTGLPHLARLNLSLTHISDVGMERLAPLAGIV